MDTELQQIIIHIESSGNPHAMRFEPQFRAHLCEHIYDDNKIIHVIQTINKCSRDTALTIAATSWGEFQIMGYNLYDLKYANDVITFCSTQKSQFDYFNKFLLSHDLTYSWKYMKDHKSELDNFAFEYNGSVDYAKSMMRAATALGF
ncbi:MAG: N-acetylmuramidase domain-containing protein [Rhabdochlamydiaceae bacterium]